MALWTIALAAIALGCLLLALRWQHALDTRERHWMLFVSVAVLPGIALVTGTGAVLDGAKSPSFCGSCHVMGPFIADMQNEASTNLAAVHYQNRFIREDQCYTCHTDYAMFGPTRAKLAGLRHVVHNVFGTYALPIRIREPYNDANCLHCHGESKLYRDTHEPFAEAIAAGESPCLDCHRPVHPAPETRQ